MSRRLVVLAVLVVAVLSACGLPSDGSPRIIAADKVPFSLLAPTSSLPATGPTGGPAEQLYFLNGAKLQPVLLPVPSRSPLDVLGQLVKGVPDATTSVATAIPKDTQVLAAELDESGVLVVTLSNEILSIVDPDQGRAFGQLVWTATGLENVRQVRFRAIDANGQAEDVKPTTDTGQRPDPLDRSDFRSIAPS
jgi:hypothetical protein